MKNIPLASTFPANDPIYSSATQGARGSPKPDICITGWIAKKCPLESGIPQSATAKLIANVVMNVTGIIFFPEFLGQRILDTENNSAWLRHPVSVLERDSRPEKDQS